MIIDTEKIVKDYERFCEGQYDCEKCPLSAITWKCHSVRNINEVYPIIESWIADHPVKTYIMDMEEKFSELKVNHSFYNEHCVAEFYGDNTTPKSCSDFGCENCWNREIKE